MPHQSRFHVVPGARLDEMPPNHSILSKARARFGREAYEQFFKKVVELCKEAGLVER